MPPPGERPLAERLMALRPRASASSLAVPDPDLAARIERLRGRRGPREGAALDETGLARRPGAEILGPGLLRIEELLPPGPTVAQGAAPNRLFLDTETTGLSGGSGTLVFLIGLLRQTERGPCLRQYLATRFAAERALMECLAAEAADRPELVTYNGKSFDVPLLAARCRLHGLPDPLAGLPHSDLLHPVRRRFRRHWPDCRLATVERRLLGLERQDDLPGSEAPRAWLEGVRSGRWGRIAGVLEHNRRDLLSLAALAAGIDAGVLEGEEAESPPPARRPGIEGLLALRRILRVGTAGTVPPAVG